MHWRHQRGLAPFFYVLIAALVAVVTGGGWSAYHTRARDHTVPVTWASCECKDYDDIMNRLAQASALEAEINNNMIPNGNSGDMYTEARYTANKPKLQAVANSAQSGRSTGTAETRPWCGAVMNGAPTTCMEAALQAHENVHAAACDAFVAGKGKGDWKEAKKMVEYWREDAQGYKTEREFLEKAKNALDNDLNCHHHVSSYPGAESKEEQQQRLAGSKRRVTKYAKVIS